MNANWRYEMIFIMHFNVLDLFKFTSRMPQIVQILVSTFKIFWGGMPPDPPRNFLFFFTSNSRFCILNFNNSPCLVSQSHYRGHSSNEAIFRCPLYIRDITSSMLGCWRRKTWRGVCVCISVCVGGDLECSWNFVRITHTHTCACMHGHTYACTHTHTVDLSSFLFSVLHLLGRVEGVKFLARGGANLVPVYIWNWVRKGEMYKFHSKHCHLYL